MKIKNLTSKVNLNGRKVVQFEINEKGMTRSKIRDYTQKISDEQGKKFNGKMYIDLYYNTGWQPARGTKLGDPVHIHSYDDYDKLTGTKHGPNPVYDQDTFD